MTTRKLNDKAQARLRQPITGSMPSDFDVTQRSQSALPGERRASSVGLDKPRSRLEGYGSSSGRTTAFEDNHSKTLESPVSATSSELDAKEVASRLGVAVSTLNAWLKVDEQRPPDQRVLQYYRWRGSARRWSEGGYIALEDAIHRESESGVLSGARRNRRSPNLAPADPDAEAALAKVLGQSTGQSLLDKA